MKACITDPSQAGGIALAELDEPRVEAHEALVRVTHYSLNRGELMFAKTGAQGRPIGWDVAGIVERSALNGQGPKEGSRVVGFSRASRGWAELVPIEVRDLAAIPEGVSSVEAATLPVAGLTALYTLERGQRLLGSRILVTGASGGVGSFAVSLGALMGAQVVAQVRRQNQVEDAQKLGAQQVVVDETGELLAKEGPYLMIIDGLGNETLARVIPSLSSDGIAVLYGVTAGSQISIAPGFFLGSGNARVEGFNLYWESERQPISKGLTRLLTLVQSGKLKPVVDRVVGWSDGPQWAAKFLDRQFSGKAVVEVGQ